MRVVDRTEMLVEFSNIKVGECFYYDNCLFIKAHSLEKHGFVENAFCFIDNCLCHFKDDWQVIPAEAEITVVKRGR
jgi:hypothetical protein